MNKQRESNCRRRFEEGSRDSGVSEKVRKSEGLCKKSPCFPGQHEVHLYFLFVGIPEILL